MESYLVTVGQRKGRRVAQRHPLQVPLEAARGRYDRLSDRALRDLINDLTHEQYRRFNR